MLKPGSITFKLPETELVIGQIAAGDGCLGMGASSEDFHISEVSSLV